MHTSIACQGVNKSHAVVFEMSRPFQNTRRGAIIGQTTLPAFCAPATISRLMTTRSRKEEQAVVCHLPLKGVKHITTTVREALRNFLRKLLRKNTRKAKERKLRKATEREWAELILEFEARANARSGTKKTTLVEDGGYSDVQNVPSEEHSEQVEASSLDTIQAQRRMQNVPRVSPRQLHLNPAQFEMLPYVESAFMATLTYVIWTLGRVYHLDAFLLLFYPLPTMYIAGRWGLEHADRTLAAIIFILFVLMGPLYAKMFLLNFGLLSYTYTRALWYRWPWHVSLLAGSLAKGVSLVASMFWFNLILRYNTWQAVSEQVLTMLVSLSALLGKLPFVNNLGAPSMVQVKIGILALVAFHSIYHVFCTLFVSALVLLKASERVELVRVPQEVPFLLKLMRRMDEETE